MAHAEEFMPGMQNDGAYYLRRNQREVDGQFGLEVKLALAALDINLGQILHYGSLGFYICFFFQLIDTFWNIYLVQCHCYTF